MPETLLSVGVDHLMADPTQPRKTFIAEELERLAASIKARGVLAPLRVMRDAERQVWVIVCGESRWRAARIAGLTHLPCIAVDGTPDEADLLADRIVENACRHDLRPMENARSIAKIKALKGYTSRQLTEFLGVSGSAVTRAEALLSLPEPIQALVDAGQVPESAAYEISRLPDEASQLKLAEAVASGRMNRDQTADAVRAVIGRKKAKPKASRLACQLENGLSLTLSSGEPLTWDGLLAGLDQLRREAKKLCDSGKDITALARSLRPS